MREFRNGRHPGPPDPSQDPQQLRLGLLAARVDAPRMFGSLAELDRWLEEIKA